ncbi:MAG TPA: M48 family metalloprotease [Terriglobales bacterium]
MRIPKLLFPALVVCLSLPMMAGSDKPNSVAPPPDSGAQSAFGQVVDRIAEREHANLQELRKYSPVVETYIQNMRPDPDLGAVPAKDTYFIGRLDMSAGMRRNRSYQKQPGFMGRFMEKLTSLYSMKYLPLGFMQMVVMDDNSFDRGHYDFNYVRREFLGDVRCLVIDVSPKKGSGTGRFLGRIWVEDQDFNIVRFNGTYAPKPTFGRYFHFDSWRLNLQPGIWLPAYVYSEESNLKDKYHSVSFKSQTRLWGYDQAHIGHPDEYSAILVDSPKVKDQSEKAQDATPVQAQRAWERMAEVNSLNRLEQAGLLAPEGEVDKVLETVINNLEITNNLNIQPEVRARVLLTAPMESFTVGHTIVLSRGLIDVLPDEAALAAVIAHELAHISLGHGFDTKYAFSDRMIFPDEQSFSRFNLRRDARPEEDADKKAVEYLRNSPYKDKLGNAGLFLQALSQRQKDLPNLLQAHIGNSLQSAGSLRMHELMDGAPQLKQRELDQIAALPLGGRIHLDAWSDKIELTKSNQVPLVSPREKMPFEVTPIFPYITRLANPDQAAKVESDNATTNDVPK